MLQKFVLKAVSKAIGCSDHNIVAISRKTKVPKAGPNIVYKRSYNAFCSASHVVDGLWCVMRSNQTLHIYKIAYSSY